MCCASTSGNAVRGGLRCSWGGNIWGTRALLGTGMGTASAFGRGWDLFHHCLLRPCTVCVSVYNFSLVFTSLNFFNHGVFLIKKLIVQDRYMCKYRVMLMYMLIFMCKKMYVHRKENNGSKNVFKTVCLANAQTGNTHKCAPSFQHQGFRSLCSHFEFDPTGVLYCVLDCGTEPSWRRCRPSPVT